MNTRFKVLTVLGVFLLALPVAVIGLDEIANDNQSAEDSSALYGGRIEKEYTSAGYLVSYLSDVKATICGIVRVDNNVAITAAHCLKDSEKIYISADPTEPQIFLNALPITSYTKAGWDGENSRFDFSVLVFDEENNKANTFANVSIPEKSCRYRLVAYGRTEDDPENIGIERQKKSAQVCITGLDDDLIYLRGVDGGICLGDSGSPIYEEGTDNVVGIISSVVVDKSQSDSPCFIGNEGIAVRVDRNLSFIAEVTNPNNIVDTPVTGTNSDEIPTVQVEQSADTDSNFATTLTGRETLLGIDTELLARIYAIIVSIFIILLLRAIIFRDNIDRRIYNG